MVASLVGKEILTRHVKHLMAGFPFVIGRVIWFSSHENSLLSHILQATEQNLFQTYAAVFLLTMATMKTMMIRTAKMITVWM